MVRRADMGNNFLKSLVPPARLELTAYRLGICRSIHLSYGGMDKI